MTLKKIFRSGIVVASLMNLASGALAQSTEQLLKADTNSDGSISIQEVLNMRAEMFARLDRNGDGVADASDSPRAGPPKKRFTQALERLADADANGDGGITKQELLEAPMPAFDEGDTNQDGLLSQDELSALREAAAED